MAMMPTSMAAIADRAASEDDSLSEFTFNDLSRYFD
jgi:hypothetical protein